MLVKEVMSTHPDILSKSATLQEAALLLKEHNIGYLPIGEKGLLEGAITDRDLAIRGLGENLDPKTTTLEQIMNKNILTIRDDADLHEAALLMEKNRVRRLAVLDQNDQLCGILSLGDIALKGDAQESNEILKSVSTRREAA